MGLSLGRPFPDGAVIVRQGDPGDCMFVVQEGRVELLIDKGFGSVPLALLDEGDFFGEACVFERMPRLATARAVGEARVLTVDRHTLLRRIHEDPGLAMHMLGGLSRRLAALTEEIAALRERLGEDVPAAAEAGR